MPDLSSGKPREVWNAFFAEHRPAPNLVSGWVLKLHNQKQYQQTIACLEAALIHGQGQPWMYEVLALSMEIENYPKEAVERVVLSLTDFGQADYSSMMFSGAYLTRFGRKSAALSLYRQASRLMPERPESYLLGLKLARETGTPEDVEWAATGILLNYWGKDFEERHKEARAAFEDQIQRSRRDGDSETAERLSQALLQATSKDVHIRLEWNGDADLDMEVEEPSGSICSFESQETPTGGLFLHDGVGPNAAHAYELYVCPRGIAGPYRVRIRNAGGKLVGNRATLTVIMREGLPDQTRIVRTLVIEDEEVGLIFDLKQGRRKELRAVSNLVGTNPQGLAELRQMFARPAANRVDPRRAQVMREFLDSRAQRDSLPRRAGAVGYAPVVQVIPTGNSLTAQPVISADRRYVRIGLQPTFNELVDVFTFTYLNGGNAGSR